MTGDGGWLVPAAKRTMHDGLAGVTEARGAGGDNIEDGLQIRG
jgi:hypothetical protein